MPHKYPRGYADAYFRPNGGENFGRAAEVFGFSVLLKNGFESGKINDGREAERTDKIKLLSEWIDASNNAVFFGGAGVSTESGVPDFRSKDGLYNTVGVGFEKYTPEYLLSRECLENEPEVFFAFYRRKMDARGAKPNAAHLYLARLEREGKLSAVVTQNIDGLHRAAGSRRVWELHGTAARNYCMKCGKAYPADWIYDSAEAVPRCGCGGIIRCDVTLYGEQLPRVAVNGAVGAIRSADMLIIGGTSLSVYPAASFIGYFSGGRVAVINRDPLNLPPLPGDVLQINGSIADVFERVSAAREGVRRGRPAG